MEYICKNADAMEVKTDYASTLTVPVKPYIAAYLRREFGDPVNFSRQRGINQFFCALMDRNYRRYDKKLSTAAYSSEVTISISRDIMLRHGFSLSTTSVIAFNSLLEFIIKNRVRDVVRTRKVDAGMKVAPAIRQLQIDFGFDEDTFPYETIKKDLQRTLVF